MIMNSHGRSPAFNFSVWRGAEKGRVVKAEQIKRSSMGVGRLMLLFPVRDVKSMA